MTDCETPDEEVSENVRQLLAHFHQNEQAQIEQAKNRLRSEILPAFRQHRVATVEATYSGYGDSGAIDSVQYRDVAGERVDRATISQPLVEQLENCVYAFLPSGFEINDGGQGIVLIDTRTAKVTIKHQENYTVIRDSSREFEL